MLFALLSARGRNGADEKMLRFSAIVNVIDINPYLGVPDRILRELLRQAKQERGPIRVKGKLQGKPFATTVVKFRRAWRLYLNTRMRLFEPCQSYITP